MEFFHNANAIRLKSHHDKYLDAEKDEETVSQDRDGSSKTAIWNVEFVQGAGGNFIRLRSCYGKYLTASDASFRLGVTGKKVVQTLPSRMDSYSIEWEPIRDGHQIKLRNRDGDYLRANGGLPPWRNSVTHDVPHRTSTQDWILWDVDLLDMQFQPPVVPAKSKEEKEEKEEKPKKEKEAKLIKPLVALALKRPKGEKEAKPEKEQEQEQNEEHEEEEEEEEGSEGSPNSRHGFRKFLHKLKGGGNDDEEAEEEEEGEGEGEGGEEGEGRFGFRKFLHELAGGDGEGEEVEFEFEF